MEVKLQNRILMFLGNNPYPHDTRVNVEAKALADAGYDVTVISPKLKEQTYYEVIEGIRAYRYPATPEIESILGYFLEFGFSFIATLIITIYVYFRHGFDIMHAHNPPETFIFIGLLFKPLGKKYVFDHHDLSPDLYLARSDGEGNPILYKTLLWLERLTCQNADMVISTNESYKRIVAERHDISTGKISVVRNGPDLNRLEQLSPFSDLQNMNKKIIGFVGAISKQDGLDYLLYALHHLCYELERSDFYCLILGDGGELGNIVELAKQLQLEDMIRFTGMVDGKTLNQYLSSMDICVDPDPYNSFNDHSTMIKMMEYMTYRKPIVAFDLHEHRVTAQDAAVYVPDNDIQQFAEAILYLMDNPQVCEQMGDYGRKRIEEGLEVRYQLEKLVKAYYAFFPMVESSKMSEAVR